MKSKLFVLFLVLCVTVNFLPAKGEKINQFTQAEFIKLKSTLLHWMSNSSEFKSIKGYKTFIEELKKVQRAKIEPNNKIIAFDRWEYDIVSHSLTGLYYDVEKKEFPTLIILTYEDERCTFISMDKYIPNFGSFSAVELK